MVVPPQLVEILKRISTRGRPLLVGGCVRDSLLGLDPKDFDIEVHGIDFETLHQLLRAFGATDVVGRSFGVIKLRLEDTEYDFSIPRRDSKTGQGHRGFRVDADPTLTLAEAAARRDFTLNAIAYDPANGDLLDPHGGLADLNQRILRHTSPAFTEDPLRVLRGFQLAARFDLTLAPETAGLCRGIVGSYAELPRERVWAEWQKWSAKSSRPSRGLELLRDTGWLPHFPAIAQLAGTPQDPHWHPEGDVFAHTLFCCDALAGLPAWQAASPERRSMLMLATLAHDFGKPATTRQLAVGGRLRWTSHNHETAGVEPGRAFLESIGCQPAWIDRILPLVANHLAHHHGDGELSSAAIRRLARRLAPATIDDLCLVMEADARGRPPVDPAPTLILIESLRAGAQRLALLESRPRPILGGRHLIALGQTPNPSFNRILAAAFEAQLDGEFDSEPAGVAWLELYLRNAATVN